MEDQVIVDEPSDLEQLERTAHNMIESLVIMRALSMPHDIINEAQLIDNYISVYAVRRAMAKAVQDGMYFESTDNDDGGWIFNEAWKAPG